MPQGMGELLLNGIFETMYMTIVSTVISYIIGIPLGVILIVTVIFNIGLVVFIKKRISDTVVESEEKAA